MTAGVAVIGWGNPSRGDDALGPLFCDRLEAWLAEAGLSSDCEIVQDFQLQIEHALDLVGRRLVLFVDALAADGDDRWPAYEFRSVEAHRDSSLTTHALSPEAVLEVYRQVRGEVPPPAFLLGVRGEAFELGEPLSAAAGRHLDAACAFANVLFADPQPAAWSSYAAAGLPPGPGQALQR